MYTQCPTCQTVFELGIEDLKAADGQVRCGECNTVFSALASLTETAPAAAMPPDTGPAGGSETGEVSTAGPVTGALFDPVPEDGPDSPADAGTPAPELSLWEQKLAELGLPDDEAQSASDPARSPDPDHRDPAPAPADRDESDDPDLADWMRADTGPARKWPWIAASAVASLALMAQALHYWRADLAKMPALSGPVSTLYSRLGMPIPAEWDIGGYHVEKGAVSDHPEVAGTLLVNAQLGNHGRHPQPYPLLKVTLLDRWGEPIGERFFAPAEYLAGAAPSNRLLAPGEDVQAAVLIVDPGQGAVSYGIDVCLREPGNRLRCAHDDGA